MFLYPFDEGSAGLSNVVVTVLAGDFVDGIHVIGLGARALLVLRRDISVVGEEKVVEMSYRLSVDFILLW